MSNLIFRQEKHPRCKVILPAALAISIVILTFSQTTNVVEAFYSSTTSTVTLDPAESLRNGSSRPQNSPLQPQTVSHKSPIHSRQFGDTINDIQIECNSDNIVVTLTTNQGFNGMIYPKGLSKNSTCMMEYHQLTSNITYHLPLKSCNTMSSDVDDGVEYFNTVMVQPHRRLVTNQGRGYHIRCRYQTKERTITNQEQQLSVNLTHSTPSVIGSAAMPSCTMRIYSANDLSHEVAAENVRIGDELHLVISLDDQDVYGMLVTNCLVRDGMNWGEQPLLDDYGCPTDEEIMPQFNYAKNLTRASVTFQAHKFPYTSSVYYQCNVRLCFREGGCNHVPPNCSDNKYNNRNYKAVEGSNELQPARHRRWIDAGELDGVASEELLRPASSDKTMNIEVVSGINVDEVAEAAAAAAGDKDPIMAASTNDDPTETKENDETDPQQQQANARQSEREFCMSLRKLAIIISLISLILMALIIMAMACIIHRRKRRNLESQYASQANIYDHQNGPYTNRGYCRD